MQQKSFLESVTVFRLQSLFDVRLIFLLMIFFKSLNAGEAGAAKKPASGAPVTGFESLDAAIARMMETTGSKAATVAVSREGKILYSRGFGYMDSAGKKPVPPDALMRIASVSKPITAAAVKLAISEKKITPEDLAFSYIGVKAPGGKPADERVNKITVANLLEHKGGWDRAIASDPMFMLGQIRKELKITHEPTPVNVIEYMLTKPLQYAPGEKYAYSNFGYCVLGRVIEKAYGKNYCDAVKSSVFQPLEIVDIKPGHTAAAKRDPREVSYPVRDDVFSLEVMDANGGWIASAPALCHFMKGYGLNGDPRLPGYNWIFFGSLPGTTAMARERTDGLDIAVLMNGRRDAHFEEDNNLLYKSVDEAVDQYVNSLKK